MDKEFAKFIETKEVDVEQAFVEEFELGEASTYRDKAKDEKKKKQFVFGGKKKSRHGESGYGKGEEVKVDEANNPLVKVKRMLDEKYVNQDKFFPTVLLDGLKKAIPGVKLVRHSIKHPRSSETIPGLGLQLSGDKGVRIMVQYEKEDSPPSKSFKPGEKIIDIDPETGKKEVTDTSIVGGFAVWINDVGKIWKPNETRWIQAKDFRDPKKVVQFLKTKVKRMLKAGYMYSSYNKEEVELDESAMLQAKMALGDADIKHKEHNGKIIINKKDKKKAQDVLIKSFSKKGKPPKLTIASGSFQEEVELDEAKSKLPPHLAKFFDKDGNLKKDAAARVAKGREKINWIDVTPKGYGPKEEGIDIEKASMGAVIKDFQDSDAPQFKGKSDKKRKEMAIAAKLSKEEKEEDDPKSKKKDKLNFKPKMDEKQMKKYKELFAGLREKRAQEGTLKKTVSDYHKEEVKEAVLDNGLEVGEQDWDGHYRHSHAYPNLNVNFAKYIDEGLEGPYELSGEVYFYDRKVHMFYSVSGEDYVDEETAKDIAYRLHKDGAYKPELGR
jgi:hypothetical protein